MLQMQFSYAPYSKNWGKSKGVIKTETDMMVRKMESLASTNNSKADPSRLKKNKLPST